MSSRVRVASLQYFIRPVESFEEFEEQTRSLVETAEDYKARLVVFPEYFTTQLLTLGDVKRPIAEQIKDLAKQEDRFVTCMEKMARQHNIHIVAGTIPGYDDKKEKVYNRSHVFGPKGWAGAQNKLHMTRFEDEEWLVSSGQNFKVFEAEFGSFSVAICYDVEFPELGRVAAKSGAHILVTPSCTDDKNGWHRVRYCAHARAIENQMYVIHSSTVGSLPQVPAVSLNYGQAGILNPCDYSFSRDGILAEGSPNIETLVVGALDIKLIEESRKTGTVLPLRDSARTQELLGVTETIKI